jgi:hypothetical protein
MAVVRLFPVSQVPFKLSARFVIHKLQFVNRLAVCVLAPSYVMGNAMGNYAKCNPVRCKPAEITI